MYGYQLRAAFEDSVGGAWPLNIGQVYTTLSRLERDDLVLAMPENDEGQRPYELTDKGRAELTRWFVSPIARGDRPRDELAIKLALATTTPGVDVAAVVQVQRAAGVRALQEYTRLKAGPGRRDQGELSWSLVLEAMIFQCEAEIRWLDHVEATLLRQRPVRADAGRPASAAENREETTA
jgi:DNA-binding PadR family transcriptional regulator